ncbi:MAG: hypothetical protein ACOX9C_06325 [Kiritimatiellia bacterium]|jgi:hypothetical protein
MKKTRPCIKGFVRRLVPCLLATALMPCAAQAKDYYWTNASGDGVYTNAANWNPVGLPETTDYTSDVVIFGTQGGTPTNVTRPAYSNPSWVKPQNMLHVRFDTAGWTLTAPTIDNLRTFESYGAGTNTVNFYFNMRDSQSWTIETGNTLHLAQTFYARNHTVTLNGGGTVLCSAPISGFGSGTYGVKIQNAVLKINGSTPSSFGAVTVVWIDKKEARLQLKTTVAAAKGLIGPTNKIRDNVGFGLKVTDVGGGCVEIAPQVLGTSIVVK